MVFPIQGHSYLECDMNMGLINTKSCAETLSHKNDIISNSCTRLKPFNVIDCQDQEIFKSWTNFLSVI